MDTDNMEHMQWLYEQAAARAKAFNIQGVTQMHTLGTIADLVVLPPALNPMD